MKTTLLVGCLTLGLASGCASLERGEDGDDIEGVEGALDLKAPAPNLPELEELPGCWWNDSDDPARCHYNCGQEPTPGTRVPPRRRAATTSSSTAGLVPLGSFTLPPECPDPGGHTACPSCARLYSFPSLASFQVHPTVGARVVIANAGGAYRVLAFPQLSSAPVAASPVNPALSLALGRSNLALKADGPAPAAEGEQTEPVLLNLAQAPIAASGTLSFAQDLYFQFSFEDESGSVPTTYWTLCPASGEACSVVHEN